jgi:hypothetical protein
MPTTVPIGQRWPLLGCFSDDSSHLCPPSLLCCLSSPPWPVLLLGVPPNRGLCLSEREREKEEPPALPCSWQASGATTLKARHNGKSCTRCVRCSVTSQLRSHPPSEAEKERPSAAEPQPRTHSAARRFLCRSEAAGRVQSPLATLPPACGCCGAILKQGSSVSND